MKDHTECGGPWCTTPVRRAPTGRPAKYCSDACRAAAYRQRRDRKCGREIRFHVEGTAAAQKAYCHMPHDHDGPCEASAYIWGPHQPALDEVS